MTITLGSLRITLFKFERLERFTVQIDQNAVAQQAEQIKNDPRFITIKQQAAQLRAERG